MAQWDPDIELDAATIVGVLDDQFPELRANERGITCVGVGWDNAVWRIGADDEANPIAFRFTQRHVGVALANRELLVLPSIAPMLPVAVSAPTHVGRVTEDVPLPWFGYSLLPGEEALLVDLTPAGQDRLAHEFGSFLRELHSPEVARAAQVAHDGIPRDANRRTEIGVIIDRGRRLFDDLARAGYELSATQIAGANEVFDAAERAGVPDVDDVFVHGDLHVRHLLTEPSGRLTGVIDWGDMTTGPPLLDFLNYWSIFDPPARRTLLDAYGGLDEASLATVRVLSIYLSLSIAASAPDAGRRDVGDRSFATLDRILLDDVR